jgi:glycerophosphoryl diester phosphodiesterase
LISYLYHIRQQNTDFQNSVALEGNYAAYNLNESEFAAHVSDIVEAGVPYLAPPMWMLLDLDVYTDKMIASDYAHYAKDHGLDIITWTLERSGPLQTGGGWYYQSVANAISVDGDQFELLNALQTEVGIVGIFSDWPATTTFFANCMGL